MANNSEAKIKFTAETGGFNDAIKKSSNELSKLRAELKLNEAEMKTNGVSVEGLEKKLAILTEEQKQAGDKTAALSAKLDKAVEIYGEGSAEVTKLHRQIAQAKVEEERLKQAVTKCNDELQAQKTAANETKSATESLTDKIEEQKNQLNDLKGEYVEAVLQYDKNSKEAKELAKEISDLSGELKESEKKFKDASKYADKLDESIDDAGDAAKKASDGGFTVLKGVLADLASSAIQGAISKCSEMASALLELPEATRELRQDLNTLTTAYDNVGFSQETAKKTWKELYAVFGEDDRAVEASNLIAKMAKNEQDLNKWVTITTGVWGTYQDSLPVEGLAEASMETAKVGQVTGVLADALNWGAAEGEKFGVTLKANTKKNKEWNEAVKKATSAEDYFNLALSECNTEAERQELITKTLTKLYGGAAKSYKTTAKSIMEANEATADLTLEQAKLADVMEPVTTEITGFKTELVKGLSPAVKKDIVPAMKDFFNTLKKDGTVSKFADGVSSLAKKVLPPLASVIKFCAENIETLAGVTLGAITVYKTFNAVMSVSTAISAAKNAIAGLTTGVGLATKAQIGWNAAMSANPIGAVLTAVGLLLSAIMLLTGSMSDADTETEELTNSTNELHEAIEAEAEAIRKANEARAETNKNIDAEMAYCKNLWNELQTIVDANGKIKEGYENRANVIKGLLVDALGIEIEIVDGQIKKYDELKKSIEDVIRSKRAEALVEANKEAYAEAINKQSDAFMTYTKAVEKAKKSKETLTKTEEAYNKVLEIKNNGLPKTRQEIAALTIKEKQAKAFVDAATEAHDKNSQKVEEARETYYNYCTTIENYDGLLEAVASGDVQKLNDAMTNLSNGFMTAKIATKEMLEEQLADFKEKYEQMKLAVEQGMPGVTQEQVDQMADLVNKAELELDKLQPKAEESGKAAGEKFGSGVGSATSSSKKAGEDVANSANEGMKTADNTASGEKATLDYAKGLENKKQNAKTSGKAVSNAANDALGTANTKTTGGKVISSYAQGITGQVANVKTAGKAVAEGGKSSLEAVKTRNSGINFATGFSGGMNSQIPSVASVARSLASSALNALKKKLNINSPSKETEAYGGFFSLGLANGIDKNSDVAVGNAENLATDTLNALHQVNNVKFNGVTAQIQKIGTAYKSLKNGGIQMPSLQTSVYANLNTVLDTQLQKFNFAEFVSAVKDLSNRPIELNINGRQFALATASDTDNVNGLRNVFKSRGLELG